MSQSHYRDKYSPWVLLKVPSIEGLIGRFGRIQIGDVRRQREQKLNAMGHYRQGRRRSPQGEGAARLSAWLSEGGGKSLCSPRPRGPEG